MASPRPSAAWERSQSSHDSHVTPSTAVRATPDGGAESYAPDQDRRAAAGYGRRVWVCAASAAMLSRSHRIGRFCPVRQSSNWST